MGILLTIEMALTIIWLIGTNIAGAVEGSAPWKQISAERGDRMCFPVSTMNLWL